MTILPPIEAIGRLVLATGGATIIMGFAGWYSWRDDLCLSRWLGGFLGGLALSVIWFVAVTAKIWMAG